MVAARTPEERLRSAYLEMPGLRLSPRQAARLCDLGESIVSNALASLAREGFLRPMPHGDNARRGTCPA